MLYPYAVREENLALCPRVQVTTSVLTPTGPGARDPAVLLKAQGMPDTSLTLADFDQRRTYDTYDGQNCARAPDWYAIHFPEPVTCNCIEMTMGFPYRDGGWWTSLAVEVQRADGNGWQPVEHLQVTPAYNFADGRQQRRPFETYTLTFADAIAQAVRVIGQPGGLAQFTSLMRLAAYHRDLTRWNPLSLPRPPIPALFRLISPHTIWDLAKHLETLTGLIIGMPFMEFYLDEQRYQQRWQRLSHNYQGKPELWFLVGESIGWDHWNQLGDALLGKNTTSIHEPHVRGRFHNTFVSAVAPIEVEGQVLGDIKTHPVLLADTFDLRSQRQFADELHIAWPAYEAALERSLRMTLAQMEAAAALIGQIANTIANLAYRLEGIHHVQDHRTRRRRDVVRRAIRVMEDNLEAPMTIATVAQAVALTPAYFCTVFTEETGHNPHEFLIMLRLERAKEYLTHSSMSVLEVAAALGYSRSYFSRLFKQRVGCTPEQYVARTRPTPSS